ncbi:MAG: hypothetical protein VW270_19540 [Candidatus Poseidoniales archaeon]
MTTEEKVDLIRHLTHATIRSQNTEPWKSHGKFDSEWQLEFVRNQMASILTDDQVDALQNQLDILVQQHVKKIRSNR